MQPDQLRTHASHAPVTLQQQRSAQEFNAEQEAARILDVGRRSWRRDDYAARREEFASTMHRLTAQQRTELMDQILEKDPNAINSWLNPREVNADVGGRLTVRDQQVIGGALADAFNRGHPVFQAFEVPIDRYHAGLPDGMRNQTALDGVVLQYGIHGHHDMVQSAERVNDFVTLMTASGGATAAEFREKYSTHLIESYVLDQRVDPLQRSAAAGVAAELLGGRGARPSESVALLDRLHADGNLDTFLEQVQSSADLFGREILEYPAEAALKDVDQVALGDGLAGIMDVVSRSGTPEAAALAVELAQLPSSQPRWFEGGAAEARAEALTGAFLRHDQAVLDAFTVYDRSGSATTSRPNQQGYDVNVLRLGRLLEVTLFNPDAPNAAAVQRSILDYAGELTDRINASRGNENNEGFMEPAGRLAVLSAGTSESIAIMYDRIAASEQARADAIGFVVDLALAAIPVGSLANDQIKAALAQMMPEGAIRTAVEGLSGQLVNTATGRLTTEAKAQLASAIGSDRADAIEQGQLQDAIEELMVAGIEDEQMRFNVEERADRLTGDSR